MNKKYEHLSLAKREKLYEFIQQKFQPETIAALLGCHRATIYRELNRNRTKIGYLPDRAHKMSLERRGKGLKIDRNLELREYIVCKLMAGWSPEIIAGFLKKEKGISIRKRQLSHRSRSSLCYLTRDISLWQYHFFS